MDGNRCAGAVGFSVRENKFYVFKARVFWQQWGVPFMYSNPGLLARGSGAHGIHHSIQVPVHILRLRPVRK